MFSYVYSRPPYVVARNLLEDCWEMLSECNAFIVAPKGEETAQLMRLAERVGFGDIASPSSPHHQSYPLTFFILHYRLSEMAMLRVIDGVRGSDDRDTRYAPIVLFTDDCPVERLLDYIQLGFDDVIALPEKREVLEARLSAQLNTDHLYYETDNYLGPDRRRMEVPSHRDERRTGITPFTTLIVRRDSAQGVSVQRRHTIGQPQRPQPNETTHFMPRQFTPGAAAGRFQA
jgi:hypothetical protein